MRQLNGAETFPAFESGWQSLREQMELCRARDIPYVIVDSDDLRADPAGVTAELMAAVGLPQVDGLESWAPRPGLQLVSPEVGALMSDVRKGDDPFYRKVLGSNGIQPGARSAGSGRKRPSPPPASPTTWRSGGTGTRRCGRTRHGSPADSWNGRTMLMLVDLSRGVA
ncbi:hypothetical protein [Streptomyces sp. C8S0]|uniref:hypothetical protein n=1 Tax=Streptomyces sp. C8S0 TaxID=2585716 RepID=UPI00125DEE39|nr:hypothetical protein [Streptomyces sp. C8S0]